MNDFDIKSRANNSATHGLVRARGGRLYHIFRTGQSREGRLAICGFFPSYPIPGWVIDKSRPESSLDDYPLCKKCKDAFLKVWMSVH